MMNFKPLLAATILDTATLPFPLLFSPKLDGIRAVNLGEGLVSRNIKAIPNEHVQSLFGGLEYQYLDAELIVGEPTDKDCYRKTNSGVMSKDGCPDVKLYVFDHFENPNQQYTERLESAVRQCWNLDNVVILPQKLIHNEAELLEFENEMLDLGYEGVMGRTQDGKYKFGRATLKGGELGKLKRFDDDEAIIIGFEERMHNGNEATKDAFGRTERSSHASGKTGRGDLGALICQTREGIDFNIGSGFNDKDRDFIWKNRDLFQGQFVKYKSFKIGVKTAPRFPVYLGMRDRIDL
jgi:DNA ligase-1